MFRLRMSSAFLRGVLLSFFSFHPMYLMLGLLISRMLISLIIHFIGLPLWIIMSFLILFVGGILIMFMLLCSIHPNEKHPRASPLLFLSLAALSIFFPSINPLQSTFGLGSLKRFFEDPYIVWIIFSFIRIYFFSSMKAMLGGLSTLRGSISCQFLPKLVI